MSSPILIPFSAVLAPVAHEAMKAALGGREALTPLYTGAARR
ncbi:MAG: hypothetical protein ACXV2E_00615 [Halobacteriota archaeon]